MFPTAFRRGSVQTLLSARRRHYLVTLAAGHVVESDAIHNSGALFLAGKEDGGLPHAAAVKRLSATLRMLRVRVSGSSRTPDDDNTPHCRGPDFATSTQKVILPHHSIFVPVVAKISLVFLEVT